jgi:hypothetical protein
MFNTISPMDKRTVQHNNFDIDITKNDDNVLITCLDKLMHKTYQESFTIKYTQEVFTIDNLDNFFNIINHSFDNNTFTVISDHDYIIINITYNSGLVFNFEPRLPLTDHTQLTANSLYIKKSEEEIEELKQFVSICIGEKKNFGGCYVPIVVPIYINLILVNDYRKSACVFNIDRELCCHSIGYTYLDKILYMNIFTDPDDIRLYNNEDPRARVNHNFTLLRPKKIEFNNIIIGSIDYSFFPKER